MAKSVIRLAGIVVAVAVSFAAAALPQATTLPQVFPELVDLPETNGVVIAIGWVGLSPLSPMSAAYFLELHGDQFEGRGIFQVAKAAIVKRTIAIPRELVRAFLTAASKVALVEAEYQAHIEHTDDYPSVEVDVMTKQGQQRIGTQSQDRPKSDYVDRTPWRVDYRDRTFVVTASDLDQAFAPFEHYLKDEKIFGDMWEDYNRKR
jgi:hypothetical protein